MKSDDPRIRFAEMTRRARVHRAMAHRDAMRYYHNGALDSRVYTAVWDEHREAGYIGRHPDDRS